MIQEKIKEEKSALQKAEHRQWHEGLIEGLYLSLDILKN